MEPINANVRDGFVRAEVDDDPLWMCGIWLSREFTGKVWVALPEALRISVSQPRIAVFGAPIAGVAAMRERVSVGVTDGLFQLIASREVSALVRFVAPGAIWVPVPCANGELCVLSVSDRSPACGETLFHHFRGVDFFDDVVGKDVHRTAECLVGIEEDRRSGRGDSDDGRNFGRRCSSGSGEDRTWD